jgi:hypothetical protein
MHCLQHGNAPYKCYFSLAWGEIKLINSRRAQLKENGCRYATPVDSVDNLPARCIVPGPAGGVCLCHDKEWGTSGPIPRMVSKLPWNSIRRTPLGRSKVFFAKIFSLISLIFLFLPYIRWRQPIPAEPWSGIRDALSFQLDCPQKENLFIKEHSENCLYLNVFTPKDVGGLFLIVDLISSGQSFCDGFYSWWCIPTGRLLCPSVHR